MSGSHTVRQGVINGTPQFLRANRVLAYQLPPPEETWSRDDVPEMVAEQMNRLQANHIVEVAERRGAENGEGHAYRTKRGPYEFLREHVDHPTTLDCGHSGIRNLGGGKYTCGYEPCEIRVGREAAREVLSR